MIRNDCHIHSLRSYCGLHSLLEIVQIAAKKGMRLVNISDHSHAQNHHANFNVFCKEERLPNPVVAPDGSSVIVLRGIEANILNDKGDMDIPSGQQHLFHLISGGFHGVGDMKPCEDAAKNTQILEKALKKNHFDLLTHPDIQTYPLDMKIAAELSVEYGFALELNNTALRLRKSNRQKLLQMVEYAMDIGARLIENSDGHSYFEIGENESILSFFDEYRLNPDANIINRNNATLDSFVKERRALRN